MNESILTTLDAETFNLDHYGLIAAIWKKLEIGKLLSGRLDDKDPRRKVKVSEAICAMVMNGFGFINRPLYLTPRFLTNKPVDRLIGEGLTANMFDDHVLGKALDAIADYGPTQLFAQVSTEIAINSGLMGSSVHLDTTSISFEGDYEKCNEDPHILQINHGYSKDLRPDLKQIIIGLCTTGPANIPIWTESHNGNTSDKKILPEMVKNIKSFQKQLKNAPDLIWVADSALYHKDGILMSPETQFITRVPNTINEAANLIALPNDAITWIELGEGYKAAEFSSNYADVKQRYILYSSEKAYHREVKTAEKLLKNQLKKLNLLLWHESNKVFGCEKDANNAIDKIQKKYPLFSIHYSCTPITGQQKPGRPNKNDSESTVIIKGYQLACSTEVNQVAYKQKLQEKGRFILAANKLPVET